MTPFPGSGLLQAWKTPTRGLVLHTRTSSPWISPAGPRHPQPLEHRHVLGAAPHHPVRSEHVALLDRQHLHPVPLHLRSLRPHHRVRQPYRHLGGHLEEVPLTPFLHLVSSKKIISSSTPQSFRYFNNPFTTLHWLGTLLVFGGTLLFSDIPKLLRENREKEKTS